MTEQFAGPADDLHRYRLVKRRGDPGGEGEVWQAVDTACRPSVKVALKFHYPARMGFPDDRQRRLKIVTDLAVRFRAIDHPAILSMGEPFLDAHSGNVCTPMPLVKGPTFREWAAKEPSRERRITMLLAVAGGIDALHASGITHGDVKPSNIIVRKKHRGAVLVDYGLSRTIKSGSYTRKTNHAGTPGYRAPETSRDGLIIPASDVYMFAATVIFAICRADPPAALDGWLEAVLSDARLDLSDTPFHKALAQSPEDRQGVSASALVAAVAAATARSMSGAATLQTSSETSPGERKALATTRPPAKHGPLKVLVVGGRNRCRTIILQALLQSGFDRSLGPSGAAVASCAFFFDDGLSDRPPTKRTIREMKRRRIDVAGFRSECVSAELLQRSDIVLATDPVTVNLAGVIGGPAVSARTFTWPEFVRNLESDRFPGSRTLTEVIASMLQVREQEDDDPIRMESGIAWPRFDPDNEVSELIEPESDDLFEGYWQISRDFKSAVKVLEKQCALVVEALTPSLRPTVASR